MDCNKIARVCDRIALCSIYGIAFYLPISKAIIEVLSILAILCYVVKKVILKEDFQKTYINFALLLYLFICYLSIFTSSNPAISTRTLFAKTLQNILFFLVVTETLIKERRLKVFLSILFISSALVGIDGIYQYFTHKDFIRNRRYLEIPRIYACFHTPNAFGCYLAAVIPFVIIQFFSSIRTKISRFLHAGLLILLFVCLLLSISRGAWFAFMCSALFMSIWVRVLGAIFLIVGILITATHTFYHPWLKNRISGLFNFMGNDVDIDRKIIWQAAWKMFKTKPWIGLGLGTFMFNFQKFVVEGYKYGIPYAHNCYLQMASEIGIIGLASFLILLIIFFYCGIRALKRGKREFSWYVLLASLAAVVGYSVQMGVDTIFYSLDLGMLFWLMLGIGVAAKKLALAKE